jgi:hypothetical protein
MITGWLLLVKRIVSKCILVVSPPDGYYNVLTFRNFQDFLKMYLNICIYLINIVVEDINDQYNLIALL